MDRAEASAASVRDQMARMQGGASIQAVPIFGLDLQRGSETMPKQLVVPRAAEGIVLALPSDVIRQASAAEVRKPSGETVLVISPLPAGDADSTGIMIASRVLSAGRYEVVLRKGARLLARFPFVVTLN
jgi:hypothetical protein